MSKAAALPPSWALCRLDQIADVVQGQSPPGSSYNESGEGLPFFQGKAEFGEMVPAVRKWSSKPTKMAFAGDILISIRAPVGPTNICPLTACIGRGLAAIRPRPDVVIRYVLYALRQSESELADKGSGSTFEAISGSTLRAHPVALAPAREQARIVAEIEKQLSRIDAGVGALKRAQANLKRYRASVLAAACSGRLVPTEAALARAEGRAYEHANQLLERIAVERRARWTGRGKYEEPVHANTALLPALPDGWVWARAEQLCDFITKGTTPPGQDAPSVKGEVPFIKVQHLSDGDHLTFDAAPAFVSERVHTRVLSRSRVYPGDVLMNIVGPPLGQVARVPSTFAEWNINQAIAVFRPVPGSLPDFCTLCLRSDLLRRATAQAKTTAGQVNLTLEMCRNLPLPLPPFAEQASIASAAARVLSTVHATLLAIQANLLRADRLRQSVLKRAFEGKLVPQDPSDEPASLLLARIRAGSPSIAAPRSPRRRALPSSRKPREKTA